MKIALMRCLGMCLLFQLSFIGKVHANLSLSLDSSRDNSWWIYFACAAIVIGSVYIYILHQKRQSNLRYQFDLANMKVKRELFENKGAFFNADNYFGAYLVQEGDSNQVFDSDLIDCKSVGHELINLKLVDSINLNTYGFKVSGYYKEFLDRCISITEKHLDNSDFSVKMLADELATCPSALYKKVKLISGRSTNELIRYIRLHKAAQLLITGKYNVNETAMLCGFIDLRYFREQFTKLFGIRPSDYMKQHRVYLLDKNGLSGNIMRPTGT